MWCSPATGSTNSSSASRAAATWRSWRRAAALPPEYAGRADAYVELVIGEMIPAAVEWYRASHFAAEGVPLFADVFCEQNAFDVEQSRRVLAAARDLGMRLKAHVDES